ncbi:MAG TPA: AAA family ATPase [Acidisarcina sp.]
MLISGQPSRSAKAFNLMKYFGACCLDTLNQCLWRDDVLLPLPPRPYAVLQFLVEHPDRLITHNEFMDALWPGTYVQPQVLRTYVLELRKLLGDDAANPHFIATVPRRGYRFLAPVTERPQHPPRVLNLARTAVEAAAPTTIHGRDPELAKLDALMRRACDGERQIVFISGEPGIGKTALVDAFCADHSDARMARAQSVEHFGSRAPLYPVKELLRDLATAFCGPDKGAGTNRLLDRLAVTPALPHDAEGNAGKSGNSPRIATNPAGAAAQGRSLSTATSPAPAAFSSTDVSPHTAGPPEQTATSICDTLEALAQETHLLLVFEDLQWADHATLDLFSMLARRRAPARLMVIATCLPFGWPSLRHASHGPATSATDALEDTASTPTLRMLKQDLVRRRLCTVIQLGPLDRDSVHAFTERELLGRGAQAHSSSPAKPNGAIPSGLATADEIVPPGLADFLHEQSGGNPLFFSSMLDHLIAQRVLIGPADNGGARWGLHSPLDFRRVGVPDTLREMIELEIQALAAPDQRLLEAAGIVGVVFPVWAAAAVLDVASAGTSQKESPDSVEEKYESLTRRVHYIRAAGHDELPDGTRSTSYVFAHPYYREVLYQRQPEVRRSQGHQRLAERLAVLFAGSENAVAVEIADHYEAAGNWKKAAQALAAMAAVAADEPHRENAAGLLNHALELLANLGESERRTLEAELQAQLHTVTTHQSTVPLPGAANTSTTAARRRQKIAATPATAEANNAARSKPLKTQRPGSY